MDSTNIITLVTNLEEIEENIKKEQEILSILKKRRIDVEQKIIEFLNVHNQPGFTYKGKLYAPKTVKTYKKKRVDEKQVEISQVLKHGGIDPDSDIINNVFNVFKYQPVLKEKLVTNKF
jgi:hypothetical protein